MVGVSSAVVTGWGPQEKFGDPTEVVSGPAVEVSDTLVGLECPMVVGKSSKVVDAGR